MFTVVDEPMDQRRRHHLVAVWSACYRSDAHAPCPFLECIRPRGCVQRYGQPMRAGDASAPEELPARIPLSIHFADFLVDFALYRSEHAEIAHRGERVHPAIPAPRQR